MSIYGSRKGWKDFNDVHHTVPGAAPSRKEPKNPVDYGADWAAQRKAQPADFILPATRAWLDTLPADIFPAALIARYPRIVNMIALQWGDKLGCPALLDDLLGDRRGGRAGFPAPAQRDLQNLQEFWYNGHALG